MRATEAEIAAFYVGVSQVLRVYLEDRFGLHAPERTTEEFLRDLDGSEQLIREHRTELKGFLTQCDMVKFAKLLPSEAEHDKTYQLAESLIESTRVDRIPGSSEAGDEPADRPSTPPAGAPIQPSEVSSCLPSSVCLGLRCSTRGSCWRRRCSWRRPGGGR